PDRVFEVTLGAARAAGLVGRHRVLDSAPLYDAVTTMDTVTLIRSALRGLLRAVDAELERELRATLESGDDYASAAKPQIDWDDADERAGLIDSRALDALGCLGVLEGRALDAEVTAAMQLLATVVGQDLEQDEDGRWRIARHVSPDRVISTVDPETRHGHKTAARGFDGYKGHVAVDPESELITATAVTPGNAADASVAAELIGDLLPDADERDDAGVPGATEDAAAEAAPTGEAPVVYGDQAYGTGAFQERLAEAGIISRCKTQRPTASGGRFPKDQFQIDLKAGVVTCPAGLAVPLQLSRSGDHIAHFGAACAACPLRAECTTSERGRSIQVGVHEASLARARAEQADA
ncbi:MAG: transposase, partial [Acidobacteriota bacterium]|nr:transposase [Acidobacteriota bacterium]